MEPRPDDDAPLPGFGELAAERPSRSVRKELDAASPGEQLPPDTGGVVSPDHSQAAPDPETGDVVQRDHAPVAPD